MKHRITNMKHGDIHYPHIFKNSYKQENCFSETITNNTLSIFKPWLPLRYNKLI